MIALATLRDDLAAGEDWLLGEEVPSGHRKRRLARGSQARKARVAPHAAAHKLRAATQEARAAAQEMGLAVWCATDLDDLADILDASVDDSSLFKRALAVQGSLFGRQFREIPDFSSFVRALKTKSGEQSIVPDLMEGMRLVSIIAELVKAESPERSKAQVGTLPERGALDELNNYALPLPLLREMLAVTRGATCLAALVDLVLSDRTPPSGWLLKRVVRVWLDGQRSLLRILAMFHDDDVPEDVLPREQRLNREDLLREHEEGNAVFEQLMMSVIATR